MKQLFIHENHFFIDSFTCSKEEYHHLTRVHRLKVGDNFDIITNHKRHSIEITKITPLKIDFNLKSVSDLSPNLPEIVLFQALPKQDKMTQIIDFTTQCGVSEISPIITERCIVKWDQKKQNSQYDRWCTKAKSASIQSERDYLVHIHPIQPLDTFLKTVDQFACDLLIVAWENIDLCPPLKTIKRTPVPKRIGCFIGPEGGLSESDINQLKFRGFECVSLGNNILRVEIAGTVAISQLQILYN